MWQNNSWLKVNNAFQIQWILGGFLCREVYRSIKEYANGTLEEFHYEKFFTIGEVHCLRFHCSLGKDGVIMAWFMTTLSRPGPCQGLSVSRRDLEEESVLYSTNSLSVSPVFPREPGICHPNLS